MPIISSEILSPSSNLTASFSASRKKYSEKIDSNSDIREKLTSVINSHDELFYQTSNTSGSETRKGLWDYLTHYLSWSKKNKEPEMIALNNVLEEGRALREGLDDVMDKLRRTGEPRPPAFSLKTKIGWLMGTALVLSGSGVGLYINRTRMNENKEGFSSYNPLNNTEEMTKYNYIENNIIHPDIINDKINIHNKRTVPAVAIDEELKKTDSGRYHLTDQTVQRCRGRLLSFLDTYIDVSENTQNKELARMMLSLMSQDPTHKTDLARISLYRTGLYGERKGELISSNVQHQLVGNLLSLLLYGQSLDDYLISVFSKNRYVSIKDFTKEIIKQGCEINGDILPSEIYYFYTNYLYPVMPLISIKLSDHSNILFGSVTWFLIYLSSATEWLDASKYNETQAISKGVKILNHFASGDLEEESEIRINFGLKFCALYFNTTMTPETLPELSVLWSIYHKEYIKYSKVSSDFEITAVKITNDLKDKDIERKPWYSLHIFAEEMLLEHCLRIHPFLFYKEDNKIQRINEREFIDSTTEHAWCIRQRIGEREKSKIQLPIVKYKYNELLRSALEIVGDINRFYLSVAFTKNDYFNAEMDRDDFNFINKSALKVVSLKFREQRVIQENPFTPRFKITEGKDNLIFFTALYYGTQRIYAIDMTHQQPLQRVINDDENIIKNKAQFFKIEYRNNYKNLGIIITDDKKRNISTSRQESTSVFIERINRLLNEELHAAIDKQNAEFLYINDIILEDIKDILIPFYSCSKSIQKEDFIDIIISCLPDILFIVLPTGRATIKTASKLTSQMTNIGFMIKSNKIFNQGGHIHWRGVINDIHIYNEVSNVLSMLNSVFFKLLINNLDPGISTVNDAIKILRNMALNVMKGEFIRVSLFTIKKYKNIAEFTFIAQSLIDYSKKIIIKGSKQSGRLAVGKSSTINNNDELFSSSLYYSAYQAGDYYAYYSNKDGINLLMGATGEKTEDDEYIYIILGEDEFKGVLFRLYLGYRISDELNLTPWIPLETSAEIINSSSRRNTTAGQEINFNHDVKNTFNNIIYYPKYMCYLTGDSLREGKAYDIYKINNIHYLFYPEEGYLRPVYDGDDTQIMRRDGESHPYYIMKDAEGNLIIRQEKIESDFKKVKSGIEYILTDGGIQDRGELMISYNKLLLNTPKYYFNLIPTNIKNQFAINDYRYNLTSFIITFSSIENKFIAAKPYLKKSLSNIGYALEDAVDKYCEYVDALNKYPTLLLSGAVSYKSELKLRIQNYYYNLEQSVDGSFYLKCNFGMSIKSFKLFYDLFTESFELAPHQPSDTLPEDFFTSPYDNLISQLFPVKKNPDMADLINLNTDIYSDKLNMRLHQAAFLQRLNPIDRMDTLLLPITQIYSWELHRDTLPFQRLYPVAALWMTWQRQLHLLIKNKIPYRLPLVEKIQLQTENNNVTAADGLLISSRYTDDEAIWISDDEKQQPLVLYTSETGFSSKELEINNGEKQWIPTVKSSRPLSVTQFMYEKDIHPKIIMIKNNKNIKLIDCHRYSEQVYIENDLSNREYFIISPGGKWVASIDDTHKIIFYNLWEEKSMYLRKSKYFLQVSDSSTLLDFHSRDYHLLMLSDDGTLYYPEDNSWRDSQYKYLWSAPKDFSPSFISHDYRFMGFKNKEDFDVILYDQKRKLATLLKRPPGILNNGYITAVSFSALNAVVALAFNDGFIYLYDLISDRKEPSINPIAHVKLNNIINGKEYNNILMRFEGLFNTLTIIHPEGVWNASSEVDDAVYTRSSYSFHNAVPQ